MTYDLRRLRLNGLIRKDRAHPHLHLDPDGQRLTIFHTKLYNRLQLLAAADQPQAPPALRQALAVIDHHIARARLKPAS